MEKEKDLRFKIKVRVYGQGLDTTQSHGYCVDDTPIGISAPIGEFTIDVRTVTLTQLRNMIQYNRSGHMDRRSLMFQEALFIMSKLPNYYNRPKEELNKFQFGFIRKDNQQVKLIKPSRECEPVAALIGAADFFLHDFVIVPFSQIPPDFDTSIDKVALNEPSSSLVNSTSRQASSTPASRSLSPQSQKHNRKSRSRQRSAIDAARQSADKLSKDF